MEGFQKIYPFTTESISGYITKMDIENKKVLTVGSSCDQALNSLLLGADTVTIFDINKRIKEFYELKRKLILSTSREEIVEKVINDKQNSYSNDIFSKNDLMKMNLYLQNDENYNKLKDILKEKTINFVIGDIFQTSEHSKLKEKFDRVILSNVLDYLPITSNQGETIYSLYSSISKHLNDNALIELYYLYGSINPKGFAKIINEFLKYDIILQKVACDETDSVIFVKKK